MSILGGTLLFAAGVIAGCGSMILHARCVERAVAPLKRDNNRLRNQLWEKRLDMEYSKAWSEGYHKGRKSPLSAVEELADTLESHNATLKVRRE